MDPVEVVRRRLRAQRLVGAPYDSPAEAVAGLGGVQSQEFPEALWALAQRSGHPGAEEVEDAFAAGEFVRTHVLRPTWHFVRPEDLGWLLDLTAPRIRASHAHWFRQAGFDGALLARCAEVCAGALAESEPRTRAELREALAADGIEFDGLGMGQLSLHLELEGLICSGPRRGARDTYVLLESRVGLGRGLEGDEALAELTRRYFSSHGPATAADYAWWSGLTLTLARRGLELCGDAFPAVEAEDGRTLHLDPGAPDPEPVEGALMLGSFDEATVAFTELRTVSAAGEIGRRLIVRPVLLDGLLAGTWKRVRAGGGLRVEFKMFGSFGAAEEAALAAEAERHARYLGAPAEIAFDRGEPVAAA